MSLYNATLAGNLANQAIGGGTGGGLFNTVSSTVTLQNTLLDANLHSTNDQDVLDDCAGTVTSHSYNLISHTGGCTISGGTHDLKDVAGLTGPLQDFGGAPFINPLLPGSSAIDGGSPGGCTDNLGATLLTDQRGAPRSANGAGLTRCDIGAYELQRLLALPLVRK